MARKSMVQREAATDIKEGAKLAPLVVVSPTEVIGAATTVIEGRED